MIASSFTTQVWLFLDPMAQVDQALTGQGLTPLSHTFYPVDSEKAGLITSNDMHRIMIQPLRQGVRLTALIDDFCDLSPLKTPYIYSAEAMLEEADFIEAPKIVPALFSWESRTLGRCMTSSSPSKQPSSPDYGLENLIKATKTSPADVIVIYSCHHPTDFSAIGWSPLLHSSKHILATGEGVTHKYCP